MWPFKPNTRMLGKAPANPDGVKFLWWNFADTSKLPKAPASYGHWTLVKSWPMLGNAAYGNCVWAGADHEHKLINKEAGKTVLFTTKNALSDYSAVTGFSKSDPRSDRGTDISKAASYRRKTGIVDSKGNRHKVQAYLKLKTGDVDQMKQALYLFGMVGMGFNFPDSADEQFANGAPWAVVQGSPIDGGHYVPIVGYDANYIYVITWGAVQKMTYGFFEKYNDETIVYLTDEGMIKGKNLDGFDDAQLTADLKAL